MTWWIWVAAGIALVLSEFMVPGFVVCFFGAGAILTGLLLVFFPGIGLSWQILIFVIASVLFTLLGRKCFLGASSRRTQDPDLDDCTGERAVVTQEISPEHPGKVEFHGTGNNTTYHFQSDDKSFVFYINRLTSSDQAPFAFAQYDAKAKNDTPSTLKEAFIIK